MKKVFILASVVLLSSCAQMGSLQNASSSDTVSSKMKACLASEASSRYQAGTLFTKSVKETATDLVKTCMKNLALQSAGISAESQSTAESIITNLKTLSGAQ